MNDIDKQVNDIFLSTEDVPVEEKQRILIEYIHKIIRQRTYSSNPRTFLMLNTGEYITVKICCKCKIKGKTPYYSSKKFNYLFDNII